MTSALVSAQELMDHPADVLLDVQWTLTARRDPDTPPPGRLDYERAHIPGAHFVDLETQLAEEPREDRAGGRHPLPSAMRVQSWLRAVGVDRDSSVVVYDGGPSMSAARAWWVLRWLGLTDVRVLDGGLAAWTAAGGPTTTEEPPPARLGDVVVHPGSMPTVGEHDVLRAAEAGVLLDARAGERYRGESEPIDPVAGHIPGAISAPTTENLTDTGAFHSPEVLRERFARLGATGSRPVAAYCGSGVTAAHEVLALGEAGIAASLYPGSWSEWCRDPGRPVATGPEPGSA
ncbi:sulfurtransferase [Actinomycetota bacterium]